VEILKTPIGEVTADHRLAQSYDAKSGKIELPNKLGAMQLLAKMQATIGVSDKLASSRTLILPKLAKSSTGHTPPSSRYAANTQHDS
jgi:hypothetical protein